MNNPYLKIKKMMRFFILNLQQESTQEKCFYQFINQLNCLVFL